MIDLYFLIKKEIKTEEQCIELINKYEPGDLKLINNELSFMGLVSYINDDSQFIDNPDHDKVYQNMDLPFTNYFINSSHNTFVFFII